MVANFISKALEFIELSVKKSWRLFFFKRNEKKNRKDILAHKMPFAARFSC